MIEWIVAFLAIALLAGFLAIIGAFVPSPDLLAVMAIVVVLATIDFVRDLVRRKPNGK